MTCGHYTLSRCQSIHKPLLEMILWMEASNWALAHHNILWNIAIQKKLGGNVSLIGV